MFYLLFLDQKRAIILQLISSSLFTSESEVEFTCLDLKGVNISTSFMSSTLINFIPCWPDCRQTSGDSAQLIVSKTTELLAWVTLPFQRHFRECWKMNQEWANLVDMAVCNLPKRCCNYSRSMRHLVPSFCSCFQANKIAIGQMASSVLSGFK